MVPANLDTGSVVADFASRDVTVQSGAVSLAGSLMVPARDYALAGVVMVGGSGPADRNNDTLFPPIREHLVGAGVAVLSYDKRGVGGSSGDWRAATLDDLARDAAAAVNLLRAERVAPAASVGIFGHSEGGWVALRAARHADASFVVTNSCPGVTPAVQDRFALANLLQDDEVAASDRESVLAGYDALIEAGRRRAGYAEAARVIEMTSPVLTHYLGDIDEAQWTFLRHKQDHDPVADIEDLRCRCLAIFGTADRLVPVAESIAKFASAACNQSRPDEATVTIAMFPGADHRARTPKADAFAPGYLDTMSGWILGPRVAAS